MANKPKIKIDDISMSGYQAIDATLLGSVASREHIGNVVAGRMAANRPIKLRFILHFDAAYQQQCRFRVEAWSPEDVRWNEVWTLDPRSTTKPERIAGREEEKPRIAAYFQDIIDELFAKAHEVMT